MDFTKTLKSKTFGKDHRQNYLVKGRDARLTSGWHFVECDLSQFPAEAIDLSLTENNLLSIRRLLESNDQCNVSLLIKVPKQFNLHIYVATGDVTLPDINGNVKVVAVDGNVTLGDTVGNLDIFVEDGFLLAGSVTGIAVVVVKHGNLELGDVSGRVDINAEDGDIKLGDVGGGVYMTTEDAHVEVSSAGGLATVSLDDGKIRIGKANGGARLEIAEEGNIHVGDVTGNIQASTGQGTITIEHMGQITGDSTISTEDGVIQIGVNSDTFVDIEAKAEKGNVRGSLVPKGQGNVADIQLNGGGPSLLLRSHKGSIQLNEMNKKTIGTRENDAAASQ